MAPSARFVLAKNSREGRKLEAEIGNWLGEEELRVSALQLLLPAALSDVKSGELGAYKSKSLSPHCEDSDCGRQERGGPGKRN